MFPGWLQILLVVLLVVLLFGRGKISELMGDVAKGIRSFREGMGGEGDEDKTSSPREIDNGGASNSDTHRDETRTS